MKPWPAPSVPSLPGTGLPPRLHDTSSGRVLPVSAGPEARMYVCGITPYDATHLGHAATYVAFDLLYRAWLDAGHTVHYVQNITDVDDPLLERATATGVEWQDLAAREIAGFVDDMAALGVLPPQEYLGVTEVVPLVVDAVERLVDSGAAYPVATPDAAVEGAQDVYFDVTSDRRFGSVSGLDETAMRPVFAERGGDPDRAGKRQPLDPLLWRVERTGEPSWDGGRLGRGRPGWHIECSTIALEHLGMAFDVQGGGSDLVFPHHEMSASHAHSLTGKWPFARLYAHAGMVRYDGEKMSKSRGNLVFVAKLRAAGVDPAAIRLAILAHHYRTDWDWSDDVLAAAQARLDRWRDAFARAAGPAPDETLQRVREHLSDDLAAPGALAAVDRWAELQLTRGGTVEGAPGVLSRAVDALLGVRF
ncbi:cysteine--1-D-myo-inosityl 2-amino-2-deoxy-alpha-D-glucopyranoside ligase [Spongisporangium articulatum]|uniref:L-cysteine:1D-myo-inositol 2-amino-2-deoxy-alpha-D-glucopyranoside ligase n=1 Tax=Spongisporangium articulatum TaxID=3362603 RepID=A0ABW8AT37_9ACTN